MPAGSRIRANNVFGTTTDNPLTAAAVTYNSTELALLPEVAGDHAIVTLDPLRTNGEPEIVIVTAHGPGATSATITRGAYNTIAREHPSGTIWAHAPLDEDMTEVVTSSTRPSDPFEGQMIYETDTDRFIARQAGAWVGLIPVGLISPYGGNAAPTGWLLCDGTAVSRTTFADLFALVGTDFGVGDGATTFNLPDLQDRVPVGEGATFTPVGTTGGSATSTATHTHTLSSHTHTLSSHTHGATGGPSAASSGTPNVSNTGVDTPGHAHAQGGATNADGVHSHNPSGGGAGDWAFRFGGAANGLISTGTEKVTFTSMANSSSHSHTLTGNTGTPNVFHTHSLSLHTHSLQSHTHTTGGPSNNTSGAPSNNTSGGSSVEATNGNMQPFQVVSYIIKH